MGQPKKGDVLRWRGSVWELVDEPKTYFGPSYRFVARARCLLPKNGMRFTCGDIGDVFFTGNTVEESGWSYEESDFQRFVREVLDNGTAESG